MAATERVAKRARAIREAAGTLSGVALGEDEGPPQRDVLADVLEVAGGRLRHALGRSWPTSWPSACRTGGPTPAAAAVSAELRARGVPSMAVSVDGQKARGCPHRRR